LTDKVNIVRRRVKTIQEQASMVAKQKTEEFVQDAKLRKDKLLQEARVWKQPSFFLAMLLLICIKNN